MSKTEVFKKFGPIQIDDARINETCNAYFKCNRQSKPKFA